MSAPQPRVAPTLDELHADPGRVSELTPAQAKQLAEDMVTLWTILAARALSWSSPGPDTPPRAERMLEVPEAAHLAGVTVKQFYRRRVFRPAIVKLGHRTARVNASKLHRILAGMRP
jgi:hypothetical protein